jgi:HK97 family phage prohead protease
MKRTWTVAADEMEVREVPGEQPTIRGYAAVFNSFSQDLGKFKERIAPGAFTDATSEGSDVRALWNHDTSYPLGRTKNGTLRLAEDARGLRVEIDPPATSWGRDAVEAIKRGDVDGMSFAFQVREDNWGKDLDGSKVRTLLRVNLIEVSPVTFPAYLDTSVGVRCVAAGDMPDVPDDGLEPVISADDAVLRAQQERERRLRLVNFNLDKQGL